eukprot:5281740-Prymnesium_polylepis.1
MASCGLGGASVRSSLCGPWWGRGGRARVASRGCRRGRGGFRARFPRCGASWCCSLCAPHVPSGSCPQPMEHPRVPRRDGVRKGMGANAPARGPHADAREAVGARGPGESAREQPPNWCVRDDGALAWRRGGNGGGGGKGVVAAPCQWRNRVPGATPHASPPRCSEGTRVNSDLCVHHALSHHHTSPPHHHCPSPTNHSYQCSPCPPLRSRSTSTSYAKCTLRRHVARARCFTPTAHPSALPSACTLRGSRRRPSRGRGLAPGRRRARRSSRARRRSAS